MENLTPKQKLIILGVAVLAILLLVMLFGGFGREEIEGQELVVWGVFDNRTVMEPFLRDFRFRHPTVKLEYKEIPFDDYEQELIDALAANRGPDIFYIHSTWLPKFIDKVEPMPQGENWPTFVSYRDQFVDVAVQDFTRDQRSIFAVPLYVDTLALYYNKDIFNAVGIAEPPETWDEFQTAVERITILDSEGNILRSGAAMGTAHNVNRSTDILSLLMLQTFGSTPIVDADRNDVALTRNINTAKGFFSPGADSLRFYTDFANPAVRSYTWNRAQHYSIDAFVEGSVAMMLNYSHHMETVRSRAPQLPFGIARAPQPEALVAQQQAIDYASYFGLAVARTDDARKAEVAWSFLTFMMESDQQWQYHEATGRPPARRDLLAALMSDPDLGVFARQALTARSWYQPDNVAIETIFADMIESVVDGTAVHEALRRAEGQVRVLLRKAPETQRE